MDAFKVGEQQMKEVHRDIMLIAIGALVSYVVRDAIEKSYWLVFVDVFFLFCAVFSVWPIKAAQYRNTGAGK